MHILVKFDHCISDVWNHAKEELCIGKNCVFKKFQGAGCDTSEHAAC